jgi:hypothetical protein
LAQNEYKKALHFIKMAKKHGEMEDMGEIYDLMGDSYFGS